MPYVFILHAGVYHEYLFIVNSKIYICVKYIKILFRYG